MTARRWRNQVVLIKPESAYKTDPTPTGAANAILCRDITLALPNTQIDRRLIKQTHGNLGQQIAALHATLTLEIELQSSGTAGTAPAWGAVLRGCGWAQTITADTSAAYNPVSSAHESITAYWFPEGARHRVLGARGTAEIVIPPNDVPRLRCTFTGLYDEPSAQSLPEADYSAFVTPRAVSNVQTPTGSLHGVASVIRELTIDQQNTVTYRDLIGANDVHITGHNVRGRISLGAPPIGTKNWHATAAAETLGALSLIHGTAAGRIIELAAPKVQLMVPEYSEHDGLTYLDADLNFSETVGDDELVIIAR